MNNILISGGSGTIGKKLTQALVDKGYQVAWLTRTKRPGLDIQQYEWDISAGKLDMEAIQWADGIFHLAGASIAGKRWNESYKKEMKDSRVKSTQLLFSTCQKAGKFPEVFISSSAIGYYGYDSGGIWQKENSRFGDDFLATLTKEWEASSEPFEKEGVRVVKMRTGIVLDSEEGALPSMAKPIKWGVGAPLGRGDQYVSWIHVDDVIGSFLFALENEIHGPFNQTAPEPVSNKELTRNIAQVLKKPLFLPNVPGFVIKMLIGGMAASVLGSVRASSEKLMDSGYDFQWTDLQKSLKNLCN